jgi:hypothetical protein
MLSEVGHNAQANGVASLTDPFGLEASAMSSKALVPNPSSWRHLRPEGLLTASSSTGLLYTVGYDASAPTRISARHREDAILPLALHQNWLFVSGGDYCRRGKAREPYCPGLRSRHACSAR